MNQYYADGHHLANYPKVEDDGTLSDATKIRILIEMLTIAHDATEDGYENMANDAIVKASNLMAFFKGAETDAWLTRLAYVQGQARERETENRNP